MIEFRAVRCPACREHPVVMEIATGMARGKCRTCKRRVWALCDGREVRIGLVDSPQQRVAQSA